MSRTNDFLANKSVMGALFELDDSVKLFLFTTHVQALGDLDHKLYQFTEIHNFIINELRILKVVPPGLEPGTF